MKPIATVSMTDKQAEATTNKLFEDLYNRVIPSDSLNAALRTGKMDRPHIDASDTGTEFSYAWIYVHCFPVENALMFCWSIRKYGTSRWTQFFSTDNEIKLIGLLFSTQYEIRVMAYGPLLIKSDWSAKVLQLSAVAPKPSVVTGIAITDETLYIDPTTGVTLSSVKVEWNNNADDENVDSYEVLWYE